MSGELTFGGPIVWRPTPEYTERCHLKRFMELHHLGSYEELQLHSITDIAWFTNAVLQYLDIQFSHPYSQVIDTSQGIQRPRWSVLALQGWEG